VSGAWAPLGGPSAAELRERSVNDARTLADAAAESVRRARAVGAADPSGLNALLWLDEADVAQQSDAVAGRVGQGDTGALTGVPIVVKDNIATRTLPTTCGSRILKGYVSPFEATAVRRLRDAGAILVAKSNMDEFGMGSSTEHSAYGPTRHPMDRTLVPGGSSGGSAVAVATGVVRIALGSETGGSVRQPAALCGVVGVKPTYGRVSRFGLVAFASSLDQVGVFGASVHDAALCLEAIAGPDPHDATCDPRAGDRYTLADRDGIAGLVIGRPREYFPDSLDAGVRDRCERALDRLRAAGAEVRDVSLPHTELAVPTYYVLAPAEASSNLARFDGVRYGLRLHGDGLRGMYEATRSGGFGPEVTRRIVLGTYVLSHGYYDAYYRTAQRVRSLIAEDFRSIFAGGVDLLLTPTTPGPAWPLGAKSDPYEMYLSDVFTCTANLAGVPAVSVPAGRVGGLPVGVQLLAPHFGERRMFAAAFALERALGAEAHA
jgi:aspartyl-tRNA(Asn)/glutamyl-tRNA(Gln) amidotransferase subunit A